MTTDTSKTASNERNKVSSICKELPVFRSYEEELEHRLEHNPSPTESELLHDLENDFDDEIEEKHNRERICFLERSASFNTDRHGQPGAFAKYTNPAQPKRSSSFCGGTNNSKKSNKLRPPDLYKINGEGTKKPRTILRSKSFEGSIDTTSDSEDYIETKVRKKFSDVKKKEKRKVKKKVSEKAKPVISENQKEQSVTRKPCNATLPISVKESLPVNNFERKLKDVPIPKPSIRKKPVPPPLNISNSAKIYTEEETVPRVVDTTGQQSSIKQEPDITSDRFKTTVTVPINVPEKLKSLVEEGETDGESKLKKRDQTIENTKVEEIKDKTGNIEAKEDKFNKNLVNGFNSNKKGALQRLYEEGLKKIQEKHNPDSSTEEKVAIEKESDNPFKENQKIFFSNYMVKRPQTLKIKVGFESPAIGQDLDTPPDLANTVEKTLPYYLKSQQSKVFNPNKRSFDSSYSFSSDCHDSPPESLIGRRENNIEYERSVELGKNLVKTSPVDKKTEKILQEAEIERRLVEAEVQKAEEDQSFVDKSPKKSLKKLDLSKKVKTPKPDYSNEIREEVEPITPDTDQSEIEEILEAFSRELKNSDVNEILSGDESRQKRSPSALRETAFLSSPPVKSPIMAQNDRESMPKISPLPAPVTKARNQVLKTAILRKEARPNSLPLRNNNGLPNTSLTLENYVERRKMNYPASGRVSAPLFKEYQSPGYLSGRRSVPVDHERNIIMDRGRSLNRNVNPRADLDNVYNDNFHRNQLRTRSLTRDAHRSMSDPKSGIQRQVIYESNIPKPVNNKVGVLGMGQMRKTSQTPTKVGENRDPGKYSSTEIEAMFWERLRQKKIRESLREQELLQNNTNGISPNFIRSTPERSTIGPIYQKGSDKVHRAQNGMLENQDKQIKNQENTKKPSDTPTSSQNDLSGKKKKDEKGFSISKIPFFRRKSKSASKEDSYKRASEDYEDYQGNHVSSSSLDEPDTSATRKVNINQTDQSNWINQNGSTNVHYNKQMSSDSDVFLPNSPTRLQDGHSAARPLPPLPRDHDGSGYGVILRNKENSKFLINQKPADYGRVSGGEMARSSPFHETPVKPMSPSRNMGIIHENELYSNSKLRDTEFYYPQRLGSRSQTLSDTESGSEAGEIQRILHSVDKRQYSGGKFRFHSLFKGVNQRKDNF